MGKKSAKTKYACQECGHTAYQWMGKCPSCNAWNSLVEEVDLALSASGSSKKPAEDNRLERIISSRKNTRGKAKAIHLNEITDTEAIRWTTRISELDRVLGGGAVEGGFVLIGGDPGIGKSTIMLQTLENLSKEHKVLYVSGEESLQQIKVRGSRIGVEGENILLASETSLGKIFKLVEEIEPDVLAIDSIQTMFSDEIESAPGSVSQVREVGARLMHLAKGAGILTFVVGHVTKDGAIAGPRVLEHMVDTVLYFESSGDHAFRILRSVKNRFGSTNEIGVFEMSETGLQEVDNPSALFLSERKEEEAGTATVSSMEGSRPLLIEVQSLVSKSYLPSPRRTTIGVDHNRTSLLIAVMEKKWDIALGDQDIYVNVVGGVRITETSGDLGVMAALMSSFSGKAIPRDTLFVGEVGLSGEVRAVSQISERIKAAKTLGFTRCFIPYRNLEKLDNTIPDIELIGVKKAHELVDLIF